MRLFLLIVWCLLIAAAEARIGETSIQFVDRYGAPKDTPSSKMSDKSWPLVEGAIHHTYEYQGWKIHAAFLQLATAQFWIFVLYPFNQKKLDFVIIPPSDALDMLTSLHGKQMTTIQSYIWVTKKKRCWEARGLNRPDHLLIAKDLYNNPTRDLTSYLNNWAPINALLA
jgi:hypothetical protein